MKKKIILIVTLLSIIFCSGCNKKSDEEAEKPITKENMAAELDKLEQQIAAEEAEADE